MASTLWSWTLCASHDGRTWSCVTGQQLAGVFFWQVRWCVCDVFLFTMEGVLCQKHSATIEQASKDAKVKDQAKTADFRLVDLSAAQGPECIRNTGGT